MLRSDVVLSCSFSQVIGKASVLDEIINYIQALQCQVEVDTFPSVGILWHFLLKKFKITPFCCTFQFLSMKLEAVNSSMDSGIEAFPPKDVSFCGKFHHGYNNNIII